MILKPPLLLLIDGNNLAHFLYTNLTPGQKMTPADSQRLVDHMSAYARTYPEEVEIELCFDRSPGALGALPENLHVFWAEYPQNGDDLLLGRLWFHYQDGRRCVVATNDEAVLEEVAEAGAGEPRESAGLRVSDFVRRAGLNAPVFRSPEELPRGATKESQKKTRPRHIQTLSASIYFRIIAEEGEQPEPDRVEANRPTAQALSEEKPIETRQEAPEINRASIESPLPCEVEVSDHVVEGEEGPFYALNLDHWPIEEGVRFLLGAFCAEHQEKYCDLMSSFALETLRPADLRALAELLLHACGEEPDFARHGALMARVRLALLQARGEPLSLKEIAARTGFKVSGLRGRIRHKAHPWVIIA